MYMSRYHSRVNRYCDDSYFRKCRLSEYILCIAIIETCASDSLMSLRFYGKLILFYEIGVSNRLDVFCE